MTQFHVSMNAILAERARANIAFKVSCLNCCEQNNAIVVTMIILALSPDVHVGD